MDTIKRMKLRISVLENGHRDIRLQSGVADVVTGCEVVTVEYWRNWKNAVGQVLVYAEDIKKKPRIHLYVWSDEQNIFEDWVSTIQYHCANLGIRLTYSCELKIVQGESVTSIQHHRLVREMARRLSKFKNGWFHARS